MRGIRFGGQVLVLAAYKTPITFDATMLLKKEMRLLGSFWSPKEFDQAVELMSSRRVDMTPLITHRFGLEDLALALETQAKAAVAVKVLVKPDGRG